MLLQLLLLMLLLVVVLLRHLLPRSSGWDRGGRNGAVSHISEIAPASRGRLWSLWTRSSSRRR